MDHDAITHSEHGGVDRVWGGVGPTGLPPWARAAAHDCVASAVAPARLSDTSAQCVETGHPTIALRHGRADFVEKYETALVAIRDGLWPIPTDLWVCHMAVVAGYFDHDLQTRVREGLLRAIRWRRHSLAAHIHQTRTPTINEEL